MAVSHSSPCSIVLVTKDIAWRSAWLTFAENIAEGCLSICADTGAERIAIPWFVPTFKRFTISSSSHHPKDERYISDSGYLE